MRDGIVPILIFGQLGPQASLLPSKHVPERVDRHVRLTTIHGTCEPNLGGDLQGCLQSERMSELSPAHALAIS